MTSNWNEFQLILAISRTASLSKAAKELGLNHSTIFRKLVDIERKWGARLFDRLPGGLYRPTQDGQKMVDAAERMEQEAFNTQRDLMGRDRLLSGYLKITSSETLAYRMLTRLLADFRTHHPGIIIELSIDSRILSLSRHEADISLRALRPTENHLWGKKVADIAWAIYGAKGHVKKHGVMKKVEDIKGHPMIGWDLNTNSIAAAEWINSQILSSDIVYRTNSLLNQMQAAKQGIGWALLPCYLADPEADLERVLPQPVSGLSRELWMVTHEDLKDTARIRAFFDIVGSGIAAEKNLFAGKYKSPIKAGSKD